MGRLTTIEGEMSSVNFKAAINNNFAFLNSLTYGDDLANKVPAASSDFITDGSAWWTITGNKTWNEATYDLTISLAAAGKIILSKTDAGFVVGKKYRVTLKAKSTNLNERISCANDFHGFKNPELSTDYQDYEFIGIKKDNTISINVYTKTDGAVANIASGSDCTFDDIVITEIPTSLASITTITTQQGQALCDALNNNFIAINATATVPIALQTLAIGFTGAQLNSVFNSLNTPLGKAVAEDGYFLEYYFPTIHYSTSRGSKILAFDDVNTLSLSFDGGLTFPNTLQIVGMENMIQWAKIRLNGVITWCTHNHAYYSDDDLATYNECTVLAKDGSPWSSTVVYDNFWAWDNGTHNIIDGIEMDVWGKATIRGYGQKLNVWVTVDGKTIRSVLYLDVDFAPYTIAEIDNINYNSTHEEFWMQTTGPEWFKSPKPIGDPMLPASWNWTLEKDARPNDYYRNHFRSNGFIYWGDYVYWDWENNGVLRAIYNEILDESKHEIMFTAYPRAMFGVTAGEKTDEMIHSYGYGSNEIITTIDGLKYKVNILTGGINIARAYMPIIAKNSDGWYIGNVWGSEDFNLLMRGEVVMLRIVK